MFSSPLRGENFPVSRSDGRRYEAFLRPGPLAHRSPTRLPSNYMCHGSMAHIIFLGLPPSFCLAAGLVTKARGLHASISSSCWYFSSMFPSRYLISMSGWADLSFSSQ